jgi:hypothetical protein
VSGQRGKNKIINQSNPISQKGKEKLIEQRTNNAQPREREHSTRPAHHHPQDRQHELQSQRAFQQNEPRNHERQNNPHDKERSGGKGGGGMKKFTKSPFTSPPVCGIMYVLQMSRLPVRSNP